MKNLTDYNVPEPEKRLIPPGDWRNIAVALEAIYKEMGLSRIVYENGSRIHARDWNLAVALFREFEKQKEITTCFNCKMSLDIDRVYRCADCHMPFCHSCAKVHFGPNHADRARRAHQEYRPHIQD